MSDYITLLGAEDVRSAAHTMVHAAQEMRQAASNIDGSLHQFRQFMDDWLNRLEVVLSTGQADPGQAGPQ